MTEAKTGKSKPETNRDQATAPGRGTEAERAGGVEAAKRKAEKDWQDSAKESGD